MAVFILQLSPPLFKAGCLVKKAKYSLQICEISTNISDTPGKNAAGICEICISAAAGARFSSLYKSDKRGYIDRHGNETKEKCICDDA
jgi:hypothetical protein